MSELHLMYDTVAEHFALRIENMFTSEESLQAVWQKHLPALPFDRTDRWNVILLRELEAVWKEYGPVVKSSLTSADRLNLIEMLYNKLDYNLFSQVLLNLQNWAMLSYRVANAESDTKALEAKWFGKAPSPFDAKAKMFKVAASRDQQEFNHDLSTLKSLKIIAAATPFVSFRVTPKGSTPALTDSCNLSMMGVGGDRYLSLPAGWTAYYFTWDAPPQVIEPGVADGTWEDRYIPYSFTSKSGGDMLNQVLASRRLAVYFYFRLLGSPKVILPRTGSLMVLTDRPAEDMREIAIDASMAGTLSKDVWPITVHEGCRFVGNNSAD